MWVGYNLRQVHLDVGGISSETGALGCGWVSSGTGVVGCGWDIILGLIAPIIMLHNGTIADYEQTVNCEQKVILLF